MKVTDLSTDYREYSNAPLCVAIKHGSQDFTFLRSIVIPDLNMLRFNFRVSMEHD